MTDTETPIPEDAIWPVPEGDLCSPVHEALEDIGGTLNVAETHVIEFLDSAPVKADPAHATYVYDLATMVDHLEQIIDKAKAIQAEAGEALAKAVPFGTPRIAFPGLRPLTPRYGGKRTEWANDLLVEHVKPRILADEDGAPRSGSEVFDLFQSVVTLNGSNAKMGGLRGLGLDPDAYCKKTPAPPTIQVTKDALDR